LGCARQCLAVCDFSEGEREAGLRDWDSVGDKALTAGARELRQPLRERGTRSPCGFRGGQCAPAQSGEEDEQGTVTAPWGRGGQRQERNPGTRYGDRQRRPHLTVCSAKGSRSGSHLQVTTTERKRERGRIGPRGFKG
jgi:hypothetical protein